MSEIDTRTNNTAPLIYLIAGESSGDNLGAGLIQGIKAQCPDARFIGVGGPEMLSEGLDSLFPMNDLSVMGIFEVLPRLGLLLRRIRETVAHIAATKPDVVVTIDSPDFCFRVARQLKGQQLKGKGIPLVHYVAPSVWAWRPKRAAKIAGLYDHLLTLLPFEPPYFEREGLKATFVGHPVVVGKKGKGERFRKKHGLDASVPILCLLPGSRHSEISRLLPVFLETFERLRTTIPALRGVIPTVAHVNDEVRQSVDQRYGIDGPIDVVVESQQKKDALAASTAALAASGTVALELAMANIPSVIAYRINWITAIIARRLVHIPYKSLVNILLGREVMAERIQERCTPDELYAEVLPLLSEGESREQQLAAFSVVRQQLTPRNGTPNDVAARQVLQIAGQR